MAYSTTETSKVKKVISNLSFSELTHPEGRNPSTRSNPDGYSFGHVFRRGWNFLSFPKWMQYTAFSDIFAQQYSINKITSNATAIVRDGDTDTWVGSDIMSVDVSKGYHIYNDGDEELQLAYLGHPLGNDQLNWRVKQLTDLYSIPLTIKPSTIEDGLAFDNSSVALRSSGTGSASATTALTVADGDASISGISEHQYITFSAHTEAVDTNGIEIEVTRKYVICDGGQPGCVATGTVLVEGSDTGGGTISAGSHLIGGIAVSADLGPATYAVILNELRTAILHANGHNTTITCSGALTPADGTQSITLTQPVKGLRGNSLVANTIGNVTFNHFVGGSGGTGSLIHSMIGEASASIWVDGVGFVGNLSLTPNASVWIKVNDKPEVNDFRIFRDQGPDIYNDPRFTDGYPPYGPDSDSMTGYPSFLENWDHSNTGWEFYIQGHWSYYNDGDPDPDYPYGPSDEEWGTYRVWVEGGEWVTFELDINQSSAEYDGYMSVHPFSYYINTGQSFIMFGTGEADDVDDWQNISETTTQLSTIDAVKSGQRVRYSGFADLRDCTANPLTIPATTDFNNYTTRGYNKSVNMHNPNIKLRVVDDCLGDVTSVVSVKVRHYATNGYPSQRYDYEEGDLTDLTLTTDYTVDGNFNITIVKDQPIVGSGHNEQQLQVTYNYDNGYAVVAQGVTSWRNRTAGDRLFLQGPRNKLHHFRLESSVNHSSRGAYTVNAIDQVTFDGTVLTEDVDYVALPDLGDGAKIKFIKNVGSGEKSLNINWKYSVLQPGDRPNLILDINGNKVQHYYDAIGVFKASDCVGSSPIRTPAQYITDLPIMLNYYNYGDSDMGWYDYIVETYGLQKGQKAWVEITSSVVDGSNIPSDASVYLSLTSFGDYKRYFVFTDNNGWSGGLVYNVDATGTREDIFTNLKNAIEDTNGMGGYMTAVVGTDKITITQTQEGIEGNTPVIFEGAGINGDMLTTINVTSGSITGFQESPVIGNFDSGGTSDVPKFVLWDASLQKYFILKWHHYNVATGVETKYEYHNLQELLHQEPNAGAIPDPEDFIDYSVEEDYPYPQSLLPIECNEMNAVHSINPDNLESNYWFLKAVPEGEGW